MTKETIEAMLLRIVEKENGEILVLYNDGRYGKASISTLREIFEGIETIEDMVGETDGWELDYTEMEDYPGKTRAYRGLRGYGHPKNVQVDYFHALLQIQETEAEANRFGLRCSMRFPFLQGFHSCSRPTAARPHRGYLRSEGSFPPAIGTRPAGSPDRGIPAAPSRCTPSPAAGGGGFGP